jgi:hypothetical protein
MSKSQIGSLYIKKFSSGLKLVSSGQSELIYQVGGTLYSPKNVAEVRSRAKAAGRRFFQIFES